MLTGSQMFCRSSNNEPAHNTVAIVDFIDITRKRMVEFNLDSLKEREKTLRQ